MWTCRRAACCTRTCGAWEPSGRACRWEGWAGQGAWQGRVLGSANSQGPRSLAPPGRACSCPTKQEIALHQICAPSRAGLALPAGLPGVPQQVLGRGTLVACNLNEHAPQLEAPSPSASPAHPHPTPHPNRCWRGRWRRPRRCTPTGPLPGTALAGCPRCLTCRWRTGTPQRQASRAGGAEQRAGGAGARRADPGRVGPDGACPTDPWAPTACRALVTLRALCDYESASRCAAAWAQQQTHTRAILSPSSGPAGHALHRVVMLCTVC